MLKIIQRHPVREIAAPAILELLVFTLILLTAQLLQLVMTFALAKDRILSSATPGAGFCELNFHITSGSQFPWR